MSHPEEKVSHGRGGAGNIGKDSTPYTDGEIVREGFAGDQGDGPFSTGRGGKGNIGTPERPKSALPNDREVVPEVATKAHDQQPHHVGRGGAGNHTTVPSHGDGHETEGLGERLKHLVGK